MTPNPLLGVVFHWLGGLASGSFYVPYRGVKRWSWETYWLVGGFFSWIIAPWVIGGIMTNDLVAVMPRGARVQHCSGPILFGVLWGFGGLTFGLTMRYLGMSLGMAVALGYCAAFGTLMPPIFNGEFVSKVLGTTSGLVILLGVAVCLAGIAIAGMAGMSKEREMSAEQKQATIKEFNFEARVCWWHLFGRDERLLLVRTGRRRSDQGDHARAWHARIVAGTAGAGRRAAGRVHHELHLVRDAEHSQQDGLSILQFRSRAKVIRRETRRRSSKRQSTLRVPKSQWRRRWPGNRECARRWQPTTSSRALAGVTWYFQFFFYTMGETQMGAYKFSSWTLHMASIIIFSTLWGIALHEWRGASSKTIRLVVLSLVVLVGSTIVVGYGNYLGTR